MMQKKNVCGGKPGAMETDDIVLGRVDDADRPTKEPKGKNNSKHSSLYVCANYE